MRAAAYAARSLRVPPVSFRVTDVSDSGSLSNRLARDTTAREAVVRPLARAAERACVRPGCPAPARATLTFRYDSREAWLERLSSEPRPEAYDLCSAHAARTRPPHGWQLRDRRPREEQVSEQPPVAPSQLGGEQTVALLAAALRSVPDAPSAPSPSDVDRPEATPAAGQFEDASPVLEPSRAAQDPTDAPTDAPPEPPAVRDVRPPVGVVAGDTVDQDPVSDSRGPHAQRLFDEGQPVGPAPRPVPAARDRLRDTGTRRAPDGPARHW
jgi:hypothetical protein